MRPKRKSITTKGGRLKGAYALKAPKSRLPAISAAMRQIKHVKPGENFYAAEGDVGKLRDFAWSTDDSPWAAAAREQLALQQATGRDAISNQAAAQWAGGLANLGATGGYASGTRERLMRDANRNKMSALQGLHRTGTMGGTNISMADATNKVNMAGKLPGMSMALDNYSTGLNRYNNQLDMAKTGMWQNQANVEDQYGFKANMYNSGQAIADAGGTNAWNMGQWNQLGNLMGSNASADAMANSQQQDGFLSKIFGGIF
jgi:hypothetical protein